MNNWGLALSGGGSRAAAFHSGTLAALLELGLVDQIDVISSVSGGSLFGAAWMASRVRGDSDQEFITNMQCELTKGFIWRSIRLYSLRSQYPGIPCSRTHALARTFDRVFYRRLTVRDLPMRPALCLNTTVLNNGQVGKFDRAGFSAWGVHVPGASPPHIVPWRDFPLSLAVAGSAAFPVGLPPLVLPRSRFPVGTKFTGQLEHADKLYISDGGLLENLGIQNTAAE